MDHWSDHDYVKIGGGPRMKLFVVNRTVMLLALISCVAATLLSAQVQSGAPNSKEPSLRSRGLQRPVTSPDIASDRRVTFRLRAPEATAVTVNGEFMSGSKPLVKDSDNIWSFTTDPLLPEIYAYNFTI